MTFCHFTIYPQMNLKWKPNDLQDQCSEILDVGLGNFTPTGIFLFFGLGCGIEAKCTIPVMLNLFPPLSCFSLSRKWWLNFTPSSSKLRTKPRQLIRTNIHYPTMESSGSFLWAPTGYPTHLDHFPSWRAVSVYIKSQIVAILKRPWKYWIPWKDLLDFMNLLVTEESFTHLEEIITFQTLFIPANRLSWAIQWNPWICGKGLKNDTVDRSEPEQQNPEKAGWWWAQWLMRP